MERSQVHDCYGPVIEGYHCSVVFDFPIKDHLDILTELGLIHMKYVKCTSCISYWFHNSRVGCRIFKNGFYFLKGPAALLELGLIQYATQKALSKVHVYLNCSPSYFFSYIQVILYVYVAILFLIHLLAYLLTHSSLSGLLSSYNTWRDWSYNTGIVCGYNHTHNNCTVCYRWPVGSSPGTRP